MCGRLSTSGTDDPTELAIRIALFGEPNPLGSMMGFMIKAENPLPPFEGLGLPGRDKAMTQVAELLVTEMLVGGRGVDHLTAFQLGPQKV